ncbi:MAG: transglycosylase SLT domain-containing protein [Woeseiaceae bacterium]|nr:transglycosylase SLT domain-containing protein [Woeseiaceae bacterium]
MAAHDKRNACQVYTSAWNSYYHFSTPEKTRLRLRWGALGTGAVGLRFYRFLVDLSGNRVHLPGGVPSLEARAGKGLPGTEAGNYGQQLWPATKGFEHPVTSKRVFLTAIAALLWCTAAVAEPTAGLARPAELEPDILFWTRVYTEVSTRGGLIHDNKYLGVVYEVLRFPKGSGRRTQSRLVKAAKQRYKNILLRLAKGKRENLSQDEARVLALWPQGVSNKTLRAATGRLRFQLGQSDKFQAGLARSGIWEAHIREILADKGLPPELVALPHVESSFNPKARSRVGAAGLWQFTRGTGRRFMRIDRSVDERMDPYLSTVAAAKLLSHNYSATGTWPLAITSYNHGTAGMRRAARKLCTKDITRIVREYKSRRFGFASRNFYVAFLAFPTRVDIDPFGAIEQVLQIGHKRNTGYCQQRISHLS